MTSPHRPGSHSPSIVCAACPPRQAGPRMLTDAQFAAVKAEALRAGLGDAELAGLAIGCPVHGNAAMDWEPSTSEVFCYLTH
jgi:hypothetical protein